MATAYQRTGRWDIDPFQGISLRTAIRDRHRTFKRVGFRFEEAEKLVEAAWASFEAEKALGGTPTHYGADVEIKILHAIRDKGVSAEEQKAIDDRTKDLQMFEVMNQMIVTAMAFAGLCAGAD